MAGNTDKYRVKVTFEDEGGQHDIYVHAKSKKSAKKMAKRQYDNLKNIKLVRKA